MEAPALCDTIFAFMGQGQGSTAAAELLVRTTNPVSVEGGASGASGEPTGETAAQPFSILQAKGDAESGSSSTRQDTEVEKEGVMLAFVGNKLGEYNLRGVEAGMDMVTVGKKTSGKVLNTQNRRQNRVGRKPYERRPAREKKEPGC